MKWSETEDAKRNEAIAKAANDGMWVCETCGSPDVQVDAWVRLNDIQEGDAESGVLRPGARTYGEGPCSDKWCDGCQNHVDVVWEPNADAECDHAGNGCKRQAWLCGCGNGRLGAYTCEIPDYCGMCGNAVGAA